MPDTPERMGVPAIPFFYTIDQIAGMLNIEEDSVRTRLLFYVGRAIGSPPKNRLKATNMMPEGETPQWRVLDKDFYRYLRFKGYRFQQGSIR